MSTCALVAPPPRGGQVSDAGTLDELVAALWDGLRSDRSVACPICGAEMRPEYGAHARAIGGRCLRCGAGLE